MPNLLVLGSAGRSISKRDLTHCLLRETSSRDLKNSVNIPPHDCLAFTWQSTFMNQFPIIAVCSVILVLKYFQEDFEPFRALIHFAEREKQDRPGEFSDSGTCDLAKKWDRPTTQGSLPGKKKSNYLK